jgi:Lhr-like helicase
MTQEINVHELSERLTATFKRYLYTTNLVSDSEPELRQTVFDELGQPNVFVRGPLVSTIPAYATVTPAATLLGLSGTPTLHPSLRGCDPGQFDLARPLYKHQVDAIEKVQRGRNVVIATGTGSGKTECFLLPILDDAARNPGAGVRAIVVYPMNALANDQLDRLRRMLAGIPEITFGRYTGDTPWDRKDLKPDEAAAIPVNEQYSREEIQQRPPHILLTNFAMLEYLLIRPADAEIFVQNRLRFVVLDEAHTYNGAQGIDVGLLMRRLRDRFPGNDVQYILTSATIAGGTSDEAKANVAGFGEALTGAHFEPADVIFGDIVEHQFGPEIAVTLEEAGRAVAADADLATWVSAVDDPHLLRQLVAASGLPNADRACAESASGQILFALLHNWAPLSALQTAIRRGAHDLESLAREAWGEQALTDKTQAALRLTKWLLILGANATDREGAPPLLQCRFHFFFRGLSGASVCLSPSCPSRSDHPATRWSRLYLEDRLKCEAPCNKLVFPLSTCSQCGMPAISSWSTEKGRRLKPLRPGDDADSSKLVLTWDSTLAEDSEADEGDEISDPSQICLCLSCGAYADHGELDCCDTPEVINLTRLSTTADGDLLQCPRCAASSRPLPTVLRDFRSGEDATTAVIAEDLVGSLPPDAGSEDLPADGRRMLVFSDSRQRAAFFAPYLKRTTADNVFVNRLLVAIRRAEDESEEPVALSAVADRFANDSLKRYKLAVIRTYDDEREAIGYKIVPSRKVKPSEKPELKRQATIVLLQHFCASSRRRSTLPGLALAAAEVGLSDYAKDTLVAQLGELFTHSEKDGFNLIQQLLQIFLLKRALGFGGANLTCRDIGDGPISCSFHATVAGSVGNHRRIRWNPYHARAQKEAVVRRSFVASAVAKHIGLSPVRDAEVVERLLERIWDVLTETILSPAGNAGEYHLEYGDILLSARKIWSACERCGRLTVFPVRDLCFAPGCDGRLKQLDDVAVDKAFGNHHYRRRLQSERAMALEVKEHTAQLTNKRGKKYQKDFVDGKINVLSSSTTFEMGVDVGALKAVFLRNVPPMASNYIQRAGRAGRRRGGAAFAVTYCRQTPHDLFHFHSPADIVEGRVPVPKVNLRNTRLAQRHVNSFLLGAFLRSVAKPNQKLEVEWFFEPDAPNGSPAAQFGAFLGQNSAKLLSSLRAIIPAECELDPREALAASEKDLFSGNESVFRTHVREPLDSFTAQIADLRQALTSAVDSNATSVEVNRITRARDAVSRLAERLRREKLIDFLSNSHWLPSYAFPQDTVKLRVNQSEWSSSMRLERDREYGIAEYAPGSEVIADGRVFTSRGLVRKGQAFDVRQYRVCTSCRQLKTWREGESVTAVCGCSSATKTTTARKYIEPDGFQTSMTEQVPEPSLFRLRPPSNTEIFLVAGATPESFREHPELPGVEYAYRRDGRLFRANQGRKNQMFRICKSCGMSFDKKGAPPRTHETAWGTKCGGTFIRVDLAHEFETDTLQIRFDGVSPAAPGLTSSEDNESFWLSFQTAFVSAAAEVLTIPRSDIDGTYRSQTSESRSGELVIYDRVPGGAGYVERIIENLPKILERTLKRTRDCDNPLCDPEASCYACLRSYGNQFKWDKLRRIVVSSWLESVLGRNGKKRKGHRTLRHGEMLEAE